MARLNYELPKLVESLRQGWLGSCQSAAVVSALLAGLAGNFLVFMKDNSKFPNTPSSGTQHLLLVASYSAVVFNCSATISSLILTDKLGELATHAALNNDLGSASASEKNLEGGGTKDDGTINDTSSRLLVRYGVGKVWYWAIIHWFICLTIGILSIMLQILIYIFLEEPKAIRITVTCVVVLTIFPPLIFLFVPAHGKTDINSSKHAF